jgi:DNA-binding CsgD family transcriptional regulator
MEPQLIDQIYESAFVPDLWPGVLDELGRIAGARGGVLLAANAHILNWTASPCLSGDFQKYVVDGLLVRCERRRRWFASPHQGFLIEHDIWSDQELEAIPAYRDFLRPRGLGWSAATAICMPTNDRILFSVERDYVRGPVERAAVEALDELRPHLVRSALMSARLQFERARAAGETLTALGLAAMILDNEGKVLSANQMIESLPACLIWRARGRIALADGGADKLLRESIAAIEDNSGPLVRSFPLRDAEGRAAMVAHVIPIRRAARDIFFRGAVALVLTPVALPQAPPIDLVRSLFDLTPAEARVARGLASGKTVDDISSDGGVSPNTVRTQVRRVLEKTGCGRQAEVVALLTAIAPPRAADSP